MNNLLNFLICSNVVFFINVGTVYFINVCSNVVVLIRATVG